MAFTQADLTALDRAYATGVRSISLTDGRSVTYHSPSDYFALRAAMKREIQAATVQSYRVAAVRKGV